MRGGRRPGAGRKRGSPNRPRAQVAADELMAEVRRAALEEARQQAERAQAKELPPMATPAIPAGATPLDFMLGLMRDERLPLIFRRDCATLALPYMHPKAILGLKDARQLAAWDDDEDDEIAAVMRAN